MSSDSTPPLALEVATFGGGCFWCTQAVFSRLRGVVKAEAGYSGGHIANPSYEEVCTGLTGHAESVQVTFDPKKVSYEELLDVFFATHDPTTLNRQGYDVGTQYRSVIFYHSEEQKAKAEKKIMQLGESGAYKDPIVTQVEPFKNFYRAEEYHQNYFDKNPHMSYCVFVVSPKITKLEKKFTYLLESQQRD